MITENLSTLQIHKLTQEQYDRALENGAINENAIYITPRAGRCVEGKSFVVDNVSVTAGKGAEVFNDYSLNKATGFCSHAEGCGTTASGYCSHAEGWLSKASGYCSHAEGLAATASGDYSHAEGYNTTASGYCSHASGIGTIASDDNQTAIGKYNAEDADALFIVGNGSDDTTRKNAFVVKENGDIYASEVRIPKITYGSSAPSGGSDGDIYIQIL